MEIYLFKSEIDKLKILINALSGIGDALMFTPALTILRKELPNAKIDAMVMLKGVKDLYEELDDINDVFYHDMMNDSKLSSIRFIKQLRKKYDITISVYPSNRKEYNIVNYILGAKKRSGVSYKNQNIINLGFLNNVVVDEDNKNHCVETNVKLVEKILNKKITQIPDLVFPLKENDIKYSKNYLTENKINQEDYVVGMHAGCSVLKNHINRRWAPEKFAELAKQLIKNKNAKVLIFGGPDENELKSKIELLVSSERFINVKTNNLRETAAIIKRSDLFITNDSGLMHIAAAMKRKIIPIIGPTNLNYIHPWNSTYKAATINLECAPCFYYSPNPLTCSRKDKQFKCLHDLNVENVYKTIESFT